MLFFSPVNSTYSVPVLVLSALHESLPFIFLSALWSDAYQYPHCTHEAQRGETTCLKSQSQCMAELGFEILSVIRAWVPPSKPQYLPPQSIPSPSLPHYTISAVSVCGSWIWVCLPGSELSISSWIKRTLSKALSFLYWDWDQLSYGKKPTTPYIKHSG